MGDARAKVLATLANIAVDVNDAVAAWERADDRSSKVLSTLAGLAEQYEAVVSERAREQCAGPWWPGRPGVAFYSVAVRSHPSRAA